jgi:hypothetical protein
VKKLNCLTAFAAILIGVLNHAALAGETLAPSIGAPETEECDPVKIAVAPVGYTCRIQGCLGFDRYWKVESETYFGYRVYSTGGLKVTAPLSARGDQQKAAQWCSHQGFRLPTGYPRELEQREGWSRWASFPNHPSDFEVLKNSCIERALPGLNSQAFYWSQSTNPAADYAAFVLGGSSEANFENKKEPQGGAMCIKSEGQGK